MTFNRHARRIGDLERPLCLRWADFRRCVTSYCHLTRQSFAHTYSRFDEAFYLDAGAGLSNETLLAALNALREERAIFLGRLQLYACWKRLRQTRSPPAEVRGPLFRQDFFVIGPTVDRPAQPRAYVVHASYNGVRLVKQPLGDRWLRREDNAGGQMLGPWTAGEIAAYFHGRDCFPFTREDIAAFLLSPHQSTLEHFPCTGLRGGIVEGLTLRPIGCIPAGSAWSGTFAVEAGETADPARGQLVVVKARVLSAKGTTDLIRHIPLQPKRWSTEDEYQAYVIDQVQRIEFRDLELRALRVEFTTG